jgi:hypothetical protein
MVLIMVDGRLVVVPRSVVEVVEVVVVVVVVEVHNVISVEGFTTWMNCFEVIPAQMCTINVYMVFVKLAVVC